MSDTMNNIQWRDISKWVRSYNNDIYISWKTETDKSIKAYKKLLIIAKYLNGDWKKSRYDECYCISDSMLDNDYQATYVHGGTKIGTVYFKDKCSCSNAITLIKKELKYLL